jgi:hypothetical protein
MDAIQRKCLTCSEPFTAISRRQKYCSHKCRPSSENAFRGPIHRVAQNPDLSCLQPVENIDATVVDFQEFRPSLPRANSSIELCLEEYPERPSKRTARITYKLTDGQQINTGYGRASRALGYVMEIWPGKWIARVRNVVSLSSSLTAAKQAAIDLYRSRKNAEPKDWLNQTVANEIDRAYWSREKRKWPVDLMGGQRHRKKEPLMAVNYRQAILDTERVLADEDRPKPELLKSDDYPLEYYEDGWPKLPACLDRRTPHRRPGTLDPLQE